LWAFDATDSESDRFCIGGQVDKGARPSDDDDDDDDDDEKEEDEEGEDRQVRASVAFFPCALLVKYVWCQPEASSLVLLLVLLVVLVLLIRSLGKKAPQV
jgi:hypothetical protein